MGTLNPSHRDLRSYGREPDRRQPPLRHENRAPNLQRGNAIHHGSTFREVAIALH